MKNYLFYRFHMADFRFRPYVLKYHVLKKKFDPLDLGAYTKSRPKLLRRFADGFLRWFRSMPLSGWMVLVYASFGWFSSLNNNNALTWNYASGSKATHRQEASDL